MTIKRSHDNSRLPCALQGESFLTAIQGNHHKRRDHVTWSHDNSRLPCALQRESFHTAIQGNHRKRCSHVSVLVTKCHVTLYLDLNNVVVSFVLVHSLCQPSWVITLFPPFLDAITWRIPKRSFYNTKSKVLQL